MEHKQDIGDLLKDRLDQAQKAPKQTLWERLDNSLEEREKKRRRAAWFWYGSAGILLVFLLLAGVLVTQNTKDINKKTSRISTEKNIEKNENKAEVESKANNKVVTQNGTEISIKKGTEVNAINTTITDRKNITTQQPLTTKKGITKKSENPTKVKTKENGFKIKTIHEYYNSDLDTTTTSENKKQIDSLVAANKRVMAIKDSIARKRATDSIKLNEIRKDSIPK